MSENEHQRGVRGPANKTDDVTKNLKKNYITRYFITCIDRFCNILVTVVLDYVHHLTFKARDDIEV